MLHNFPELVVTLDLYYRKIPAIRTAIKYAEWRADFKKVATLKVQEQMILKKINRFINYYKSLMENEYLEKKIYGSKLLELEQYFEKELEEYRCDWYHFH